MKKSLVLLALVCCLTNSAVAQKPLKALLIAGGCCHDYKGQTTALSKGIQSIANVQVDVFWVSDASTNPPLPLYDKATWADGYDVIIHDECAAGNKDIAVMQRILEVHKTIPSVHLHCAMHSFRNGTDAWAKHLGLLSTGHGPQVPIEINFKTLDHPITKTLQNWTTGKEELYNNAKMYSAQPLAVGKQLIQRGDKTRTAEAVVVWTNEIDGVRSFSTTLGHNTDTVKDPRYIELVTRGLLWSCDRLNDDVLVPFKGKNKIRLNEGVESYKQNQAAKKAEAMAAKMPKDATLVKVSASSVQSERDAIYCVDGDRGSRWCASGSDYPQWLQLEFKEPKRVTAIKILWEFARAYQYQVSGSLDGKTWSVLSDQSDNNKPGPFEETFSKPSEVKFLKIDGLGSTGGGWCSIYEINVKGDGIKSLWPAAMGKGFRPAAAMNENKNSGNIQPQIVPKTPAEAELLKSVRVPDGFEATIFAAPPAVNYPVFVAAAPDGTLFVSSDGNGSLGRDPERGRVIRLRDNDGDGRADQTNVFCEVDSPRGLVWDYDRLYLMHPPHLSVFIDRDRDGVADEQKVLVKNLAFGYDKRPADHTTNGLSLGVDGYLYVAGGDFGFMEAEGSDGTKLTHRGGGVIRVRPDGTGLELYSTGTRNILEVAISPKMEMFARDNTNDGGGWDVRFHHFTGGDDHGYPRLYKNFNDECVQPLADYGGGSGCGAFYLHEPGFGKWNDAPITADWGKSQLFHHKVAPQGATFRETQPPTEFIRIERATDGDVDAMSRVYAASWRGATFKWAGPNVGFIVCVKPKDFRPEPLPDFQKLSDDGLVKLFDSPSYRRRLAAQRELVRRGNDDASLLFTRAIETRDPDRNLIDQIRDSRNTKAVIDALGHSDPVIVHVAIRELAKRKAASDCLDALDNEQAQAHRSNLLRALAKIHSAESVDGLLERYAKSTDPVFRQGCLSALCRLHFVEGVWKGQSWGTRPDTRGPYYQPEPWSQTDRILAFLKSELAVADAQTAAFLVREMNRNRIQSNEATERILDLASKDDAMIPDAVRLVAATNYSSQTALPLLIKAANNPSFDAVTLSAAVVGLSRYDQPRVVDPIVKAISRLDNQKGANKEQQTAQNSFFRSKLLQNQIRTVCEIAKESDGLWANAAILDIASRKNASPEARATCESAIEEGWANESQRMSLITAAKRIRSHHIDQQILAAVDDPNATIANAARDAVKQLRIKVMPKVDSPLVATMTIEKAVAAAIKTAGDRDHGEVLFTKANCVACHTISKSVPQKGPYLGNIAQTYKRPELVTAILQPGKTIAQGFATTNILTEDGKSIVGFVTKESAEAVTLRDANAKEFVIDKDEIEVRRTLKTSVMPNGLMDKYSIHDVASLVEYLEDLAKN